MSQAEIGDLLALQKKLSTTPVINSLACTVPGATLLLPPQWWGMGSSVRHPADAGHLAAQRWPWGLRLLCWGASGVYPFHPHKHLVRLPMQADFPEWGRTGPLQAEAVSCPGLYGENKELASGMLGCWYRGRLEKLGKGKPLLFIFYLRELFAFFLTRMFDYFYNN